MLRWVVLPSVAATLILVLLVLTCRLIWRTSRPLGVIVAAGMAVRIAAATVLFWASYLHLPVLSSLQLGGGFWRMAFDAFGYHLAGLYAAEGTLASITEGSPSPAYVQALALWMRLAGTSPFSAVLLNLTCYVATCGIFVGALHGLTSRHAELVRRVTLLALSASPMLVFVSTQVLKDDFFLLFSALLSTGVWWITLMLAAPRLTSWRRLVLGLLAVSVGVFVTAGVRVYYPGIAILCVGLAFIVALLGSNRASWRLVFGCAVLTMVTAGTALTFGSEEGRNYLNVLSGAGSPVDAIDNVDRARAGFVSSGGSTNIGEMPTGAPGVTSRLRGVAMGLATMFVPLVVLRTLDLVALSGGAAMMALGDLDTLFFDAVFVAVATLTWRMRRESRPNVAFLTFAVGLVLLLCVLMGYTVTNVGTLVRLRLMVLAPLVTMPLAFSRLPRYLWEDDRADALALSAAAPTPVD